MKKLLTTTLAFLLLGCLDNNNDSQISNEINPPAPPGVTTPTITVTQSTSTSSVTVSWHGVPSIWNRYRVCKIDASNNCDELSAGPVQPSGEAVVTIGAGSGEVSLSEVLKDDFEIRFYDTDHHPVNTIELDLASIAVSTVIQRFGPNTKAAEDAFGSAVAMSENGTTLAVGAPKKDNKGAVYIFDKQADNSWQQSEHGLLTAKVLDTGDDFGASLSLSDDGNSIAVGMPGEDSNATGIVDTAGQNNNTSKDSGAVVVLKRSDKNTAWAQTAFLKAQTNATNDKMGSTVALSGNGSTLAFASALPNKHVSTFVYIDDNANPRWLSFDSIAPASVAGTTRVWGSSLAFNADALVLAIGATDSDGANADPVALYKRNSGDYAEADTVTVTGEGFGSSVDFSKKGRVLAIGTKSGNKAYVYDVTADAGNFALSDNPRITLEGPFANSEFGSVISLTGSGERLAVYSKNTTTPAPGISTSIPSEPPSAEAMDLGGVTIYDLTQTPVASIYYFQVEGSQKEFGSALAFSGNGAGLVAATPKTGDAQVNEGAAWLLTLGEALAVEDAGDALGSTPTVPNFPTDAELGLATSVGANGSLRVEWNKDSLPFWVGKVKLCMGTPCQEIGSADANSGTVSFPSGNDSLSPQDLLNGSFSTIFYDAEGNEIKVSSITISQDLLGTFISKIKAHPPTNGSNFGSAVAVNSDGTVMAVGVPNDATDGADSGAVLVFTKGANGAWTQDTNPVKAGTVGQGDLFGTSVAISDNGLVLAVGAPDEDSNGTGITADATNGDASNSGAMYIFERSSITADWTQTAYLKPQTSEAGLKMGTHVALSGNGKTAVFSSGVAGKPITAFIKGKTSTTAKEQWLTFDEVEVPSGFTAHFWGQSLSLTRNGFFLVVGAINESASSAVGAVRTYTRIKNGYTDANFTQLSQTGASKGFGNSVDLSSNGSVLAVGSSKSGTSTELVRIYTLNSAKKAWDFKLNVNSNTDTAGTGGYEFGSRISLTEDGQRLIVSSKKTKNSEISQNPGLVKQAEAGTAGNFGGLTAFTLDLDATPTATQQYYLQPVVDSGSVYSEFASTLAISGNGATVIGATPIEGVNLTARQGAAWAVNTGEDGNAVADTDDNNNANGITPAIPSIPSDFAITASQSNGKITLSWDPDELPFWVNRISVCLFDGTSCASVIGAGATAASGSYRFDFQDPNISYTELLTKSFNFNFIDEAGDSDLSASISISDELKSAIIQFIKASATSASDVFGTAVALSQDGSTLAIGIPSNNTANPQKPGGVAIFSIIDNEWKQSDKLVTASTPANGDRFGASLALSDDGLVLAVGAPGDSTDAANSGAIAIYKRADEDSDWTIQKTFKAQTPVANHKLGAVVAISGDGSTVAASYGAPGLPVLTYVQIADEWQLFDSIGTQTPSTLVWGQALAFNRNSLVLAISAVVTGNSPSYDVVVVHEKTSTGYVTKPRPNNLYLEIDNEEFGSSLALSARGNILVAGAPGASKIYIYKLSHSGVAATTSSNLSVDGEPLVLTGIPTTDFGAQVDLTDGGKKLVLYSKTVHTPTGGSASGVVRHTDGITTSASERGSISLYELNTSTTPVTATPSLYLQPNEPAKHTEFGSVLALSGDGTFLLGAAPNDDSGSLRVNDKESSNANVTDSGAAWLLNIGGEADTEESGGFIPAPSPPFIPSDLTGTTSALEGDDRKTGTITVSWNTAGLPDGLIATLCFRDSTQPNNCREIPSTSAGDPPSSLTFELFKGLSLDELLGAIGNNNIFIFLANAEGVEGEVKVEITQELINSLVQYFKRTENNSDKNTVGDLFGSDVAISGDGKLMVIGAPNEESNASSNTNQGAIITFVKVDNIWQPATNSGLRLPDFYARFGQRLALSDNGNTLAVALPGTGSDGSDSKRGIGSIKVYSRSGNGLATTWTFVQDLAANSFVPNQQLGHSDLSISGDGTVIAASLENTNRIAIFLKSGAEGSASWTAVSSAETGATNSKLGHSIAISYDGSLIVAGAPNFDSSADITGQSTGKVYIFNKTDPTNSSAPAFSGNAFAISPPNEQPDGNFGSSVSISGVAGDSPSSRLIAVGSSLSEAYLYKAISNTWAQRNTIRVPTQNSTSYKGFARNILLSKDGNTLAIAATESPTMPGINAPITDATADSSNGAVLIYSLPAEADNNAQPKYRLQNVSLKDDNNFGVAMAFSRTAATLVSTASLEDSNATGINGDETNRQAKDSGAAWVYPLRKEPASSLTTP